MVETGVVATPDGRALAMCQWGPPDGAPMFYLHGTPGSRLMRHVDGTYERAGVRVITYDRPGYGRSPRLPGRQVAHAAADVAVIADHLGLDRFAVCGVSGGGPHALAVCAMLGRRVTRGATVVCVGPYAEPDLDFFAGLTPEDAEDWRVTERGGDALVAKLQAEAAGLREAFPPDETADAVHQMLAETLVEATAEGIDGMLDDELSLIRPWGFNVADIAVPVQIMAARDDELIPPAQSQWLADHIRTAELVVVPGDHLGFERNAEEEKLIAWLAGGHSRGAQGT
ncbi:alpha/beta fold hydrolase [Paractinoplanes rishiriensis]|uniref:Alpha/beta hydrolase n=1 Tax=Paractinoplanes rishiriensis TaxID=1050105 RepID=A0A919K059_9ACTN|nr:alpha/beta hydrolase [Actinoplanes rishiriensis]GIE96424.1 alpha/beta hydrolase [Actinoplanes rishiriensis]